MEQKPSNLNKQNEKPTRTVEELEAMLAFANSQIEKLKQAGSQDKRLLAYLNEQKEKAEREIVKLEKGNKAKNIK